MSKLLRRPALVLLLLTAMLTVAPPHLGAEETTVSVNDTPDTAPVEIWDGIWAALSTFWSSIASPPPPSGSEPPGEDPEYDVGVDPSG